MSTTLSYGYKRPETGDSGGTFWSDLEFDITRLNDHTHDGSNSALLTPAAFGASTVSIASGSWSSDGSGMYSQVVSMPGSLTFDSHTIEIRDTSGVKRGAEVEKVTSTTFRVRVNNNALALVAVVI